MKFQGKALVMGDNVNTDVLHPSRFFSLDDRTVRAGFLQAAAGYEQVGSSDLAGRVIVAGENFGCGSSREHAPIALASAGIVAVVAEFYARIFYRNSVNGGYLVPFECQARLCEQVCTGDKLVIDVPGSKLTNETTGDVWELLPLGEVAPILEAGGLFPYAQKVGMLKT